MTEPQTMCWHIGAHQEARTTKYLVGNILNRICTQLGKVVTIKCHHYQPDLLYNAID